MWVQVPPAPPVCPSSSTGVDGLTFPPWFDLEITFRVEPCTETGGYVARWDDPAGGGITTQGDSLAELQSMVSDAVGGYFADTKAPAQVRRHFV